MAFFTQSEIKPMSIFSHAYGYGDAIKGIFLETVAIWSQLTAAVLEKGSSSGDIYHLNGNRKVIRVIMISKVKYLHLLAKVNRLYQQKQILKDVKYGKKKKILGVH